MINRPTSPRISSLHNFNGMPARKAPLLIAAAASFLFFLPLVSAVQVLANDTARAYRLAPGDKINVKVLGEAELSGDFVVDGDGNIQLPLAGTVDVMSLTVAQSRERIIERLSDGILTKPSVSVRITELQPIYVLGEVRTPGSYAFRFNSTVKSVLALAGGAPTQPLQAVAIEEFLQADEHVRQLVAQQKTLLVRKGRLDAEREGRSTFSLPLDTESTSDEELLQMIAYEREALANAVTSRRDQVTVLRTQQQRLREGVEALNAQLAAHTKQIALAKEKMEIYDELKRKGYGHRPIEIDARLAEAGHESELWRLKSEISRFEASIAEIDVKIDEIEAIGRKQVVAELQDVRDRLRDVEAVLPSARQMRDVKLELAGGHDTASDAFGTYTITRSRNGSVTVHQVPDTELVQPGDVVEVKRVQSSPLLETMLPVLRHADVAEKGVTQAVNQNCGSSPAATKSNRLGYSKQDFGDQRLATSLRQVTLGGQGR